MLVKCLVSFLRNEGNVLSPLEVTRLHQKHSKGRIFSLASCLHRHLVTYVVAVITDYRLTRMQEAKSDVLLLIQAYLPSTLCS